MDTNNFNFPDAPVGLWGKEDFDRLLLWADELDASDITFQVGDPPWIKVNKEWHTVTRQELKRASVANIADEISKSSNTSVMVMGGEPRDLGYQVLKSRGIYVRYRGNITAMQTTMDKGLCIILRTIPSLPPKMDDLKVDPYIREHGFPQKGLVLITGVMGSGKSTLNASMLRHIAETERRSIQTFEHPIEFDLSGIPDKIAPISQSEIPYHIKDFTLVARNAARRAADVILVGESRDQETLRGMIEAAEIGVAAYSTAHTRSVAETPSRIINVFPQSERAMVATTLISTLSLIVQQRLVPKVGGGLIAVKEYLAFDEKVKDELLQTDVENLIVKIKELVERYGKPLLIDAKEKLDNGIISESEYEKIEKEFEKELCI